MTFSQAYTLFGPDVETIAEETGIPAPQVDRLINAEMNRQYEEKRANAASYNREYHRRRRDELREIRGRAAV